MSEKYICSNCNSIVSLNQSARCEKCDSDAVHSVERIQSIIDTNTFVRQLIKQPITHAKVDDIEFGWLLERIGFETFVSKKDAKNFSDAIQIALKPEHAWYIKIEPKTEEVLFKLITRNQWCDWVRS